MTPERWQQINLRVFFETRSYCEGWIMVDNIALKYGANHCRLSFRGVALD